MDKEDLKQALLSILVGACVAFVTTFLEGVIQYLNGTENNILAGIVSTVMYRLRTFT